jgi:hypothetical protein
VAIKGYCTRHVVDDDSDGIEMWHRGVRIHKKGAPISRGSDSRRLVRVS